MFNNLEEFTKMPTDTVSDTSQLSDNESAGGRVRINTDTIRRSAAMLSAKESQKEKLVKIFIYFCSNRYLYIFRSY